MRKPLKTEPSLTTTTNNQVTFSSRNERKNIKAFNRRTTPRKVLLIGLKFCWGKMSTHTTEQWQLFVIFGSNKNKTKNRIIDRLYLFTFN